jgi:tRNA(His) 5'-end guanylyltransferase
MKDSLGDRMKADYENRMRFLLPRRTYTIIRVDGRNFHRYTRGCARPLMSN